MVGPSGNGLRQARGRRPRPALGFGLWTASLVAIVLAVNLAGAWEIASALRGLREHGQRTLQFETTALARTVEARLASATADLAFLAGSAVFEARGPAGRPDGDELGAALLLFLRGHPLVASLVVVDGQGAPLLAAGRPRGVPGYWTPAPDAPPPPGGLLHRTLEVRHDAEGPGRPARLEARLDPQALLREPETGDRLSDLACRITDREGRALAGREAGPGRQSRPGDRFASGLMADDWGAPSPWTLVCEPADGLLSDTLAPLVARHRLTIVLNLAVMALAAGLGFVAFQQARRGQRSEHRAREEARVRELERQLFHAERLSTVGRLAAGMAHEINNPLEGMSNYLRLAADAAERGDMQATRRRLDGVRQGLERAASVVRRVLDHAQPGGHHDERIDLAAVVTQSLEFVRSRGEFDHIAFHLEAPGPVWIRGHATMLGQLFLNLILNACEAQPDGGEVTARCSAAGGWAVAEIADRGPGVPAARRSRIFEPFETTKRSSGLGLSICHSIVQQHAGELTVDDRERGGAVFRVRLKLDAGKEADRAAS